MGRVLPDKCTRLHVIKWPPCNVHGPAVPPHRVGPRSVASAAFQVTIHCGVGYTTALDAGVRPTSERCASDTVQKVAAAKVCTVFHFTYHLPESVAAYCLKYHFRGMCPKCSGICHLENMCTANMYKNYYCCEMSHVDTIW